MILKKSIERILGCTIGMAFLVSYSSTFAHTQINGRVSLVRTHSADLIPNWAPPMFWFTMQGITAAENCSKFSNGEILFVGHDIQMLAMVMSAMGKGWNVTVDIDAPDTANGFCIARHVTVSRPT